MQLNELLVIDGERRPVLVPTIESFVKDNVNPSLCVPISSDLFNSIIHLDVGVYYFYKGQLENAITHFQQQTIPTENFPYLKITQEKLNGYLKGLGLQRLENQSEQLEPLEPETVRIAKLVWKGEMEKLKETMLLDFAIDNTVGGSLNPNSIEVEEVQSRKFYELTYAHDIQCTEI